MSTTIFSDKEINPTTIDNQKLKNTFSDEPVKEQASCNTATHIAILPVRIAIDDFSCEGDRACQYVAHSIPLTTCHYTLKQLINGWLYVYEEKYGAVFEYEVKDHNFIQHGIFPYDMRRSLTREFIKLNETTEVLPYIRCSTDSKITLFYSKAKASETLRESWVSLSSTWSKRIDIPAYQNMHKGFPEKKWRRILNENGSIEKINRINKNIDEGSYTHHNNELYNDLSSLLESLRNAKISELLINKLFKCTNTIGFYSNTASNKNDNSMSLPKNKLSIENVEENNTDSNKNGNNMALSKDKFAIETIEQKIKTAQENPFYTNCSKVKKLLEEIINLSPQYTDSTMPLKELYFRVEDINVTDSYSSFISRSQKILNKLEEDVKVKGQPLNMLAMLNDPVTIIEDLAQNLEEYRDELIDYNSTQDIAYKKVIAESCLQLLYPKISEQASIKNTIPLHKLRYDKETDGYNPFTYYSHLSESYSKFRSHNTEEKNYDMLKEKELFNFLVEYESKQYEYHAREKDLVMWLNFCNEKDGRDEFTNSIGFDLEDEAQHEFIFSLFCRVLNVLAFTDEGKEWIGHDLENKGILSGSLWAFDKTLESIINFYLKANGFNCDVVSAENKSSNLATETNENSSLDSAIMANRVRDAAFKVIDTESFQKSRFKNAMSSKTEKLFERLLTNNTFKNLYMNAFILLGNALNPVRLINKANTLLPYATLYTVTNKGIAMKLNPNFNIEFKNWLKTQGEKLKNIQKIQSFVYFNKATGNNGYAAKQQEQDLRKKENNHSRKAQTKAEKLTYITESYSQTHPYFTRKDTLPPIEAYRVEYQDKIKPTDIGICIDLILSVWQVASALQVANNKVDFTADDYLNFSVVLINFITSTANVISLKLKTINLTKLHTELMNASKNSRIHISDKLAKLNDKITYVAKVGNIAGCVLSALYAAQYVRQSLKASNHAEFLCIGVAVGCSVMLTCLGFAAIFGAECPPLAITFIVIGIAADLFTRYFHRTDLQLWLEHCRWGKKYSLENHKDNWHFSSLKEELDVLYSLIGTPFVQLEYQPYSDKKYPITQPVIINDRFRVNDNYIYKIETIVLSIAMPLLTIGSKASFEIYCENNGFSLPNDAVLSSKWIVDEVIPVFKIKICTKSVINQSLYLVINLPKENGNSELTNFVYHLGDQREEVVSSSSDGSILKKDISVLSNIDSLLHKPKAKSFSMISMKRIFQHNDFIKKADFKPK